MINVCLGWTSQIQISVLDNCNLLFLQQIKIESNVNHSRFKLETFCCLMELITLTWSAKLEQSVLFQQVWPFFAVFIVKIVFFNSCVTSVMAQDIHLSRRSKRLPKFRENNIYLYFFSIFYGSILVPAFPSIN